MQWICEGCELGIRDVLDTVILFLSLLKFLVTTSGTSSKSTILCTPRCFATSLQETPISRTCEWADGMCDGLDVSKLRWRRGGGGGVGMGGSAGNEGRLTRVASGPGTVRGAGWPA
jgi:hypothetical protein